MDLIDALLKLVIPPQKMVNNKKLPYILDFKNEKARFAYIGVKHSNDPKNIQFKKIELLLKKFLKATQSKKIVIGIESIPPHANLPKNKLIEKYGESGLLAYFAKMNNLKIICPEPTQYDMLKLILFENKFNKLDILSWIYLNMLCAALKKEESLQVANIKIKPLLDQIIKKYGFKKINKDPIMQIQRKIINLYGKSISKMSKQELCALQDPFKIGSPFNDVGAEFNTIRDKFIARNFLDVLIKGKNIFSIYGFNHVIAQEPVFKVFFKNKAAANGRL